MYKIFTILLMLSLIGCRNHDYINYDNDSEAYNPDQVDLSTYPDWTEYTHGITTSASPDYDEVFAQSKVLELSISISSTNWSAMLADLKANYSNLNNSDSDYTPMWVPCTVSFNDIDWYEVGVRFKGNSSLQQTYSSSSNKYSLKLDFDQYEDDYYALTNQRFYGFKQLNLNNNYNDSSLMREKVGADLFREFGLASAQTAFYKVYLDNGSGEEYYGVYTLVEEVDDTVIKTQFDDSSGNLYKPDGDAASFKSGSYDKSELYLKTNTSTCDYSDVQSLYDIINNYSNTEAWRAELEAVFDVDNFLRWLAANATIQNWDTYGNMTHNYYLYNYKGRLTWIPWDNNEAFQSGMGQNSAIEVSKMGSVGISWPLIKYIYGVSSYQAKYKEYLQEFIDEVFVTSDMQSLYTKYASLLSNCGDSTYSSSAVNTLKSHVSSRNTTVTNYLK